MSVPAQPKLYHITHVDNLPAILATGCLWSDATMIDQCGPVTTIGMGSIKQRRLGLPVKSHPGDSVGAYGKVVRALNGTPQRPAVEVHRDWYF